MKTTEFHELSQTLKVESKQYTKPIRLYCDIDGVIQPYLRTIEDLEALDGQAPVKFYRGTWTEEAECQEGTLYFKKFVQEKLSELSQHPLIDFVWLTAWRVNAPLNLDKHMKIKSLGYLQWEGKPTDYNHVFKRVAIREDQKDNPSEFIWLEDLANTVTPGVELFSKFTPSFDSGQRTSTYQTIIPPDRFLSINTESTVGLLPKHFQKIDKWVEDAASRIALRNIVL